MPAPPTSASRSPATRTSRCSSCAARRSSGCCARPSLAEPDVEVRTGVGGRGPPGDRGRRTAGAARRRRRAPRRRHDGSTADIVVAASGRRSADARVARASIGVDVPETVHESGLMYLSRWYRPPVARRAARREARRRPRVREVPRRARRRRHAVDHARHPHPTTASCAPRSATPTASSRRAGCSPGPDQFFAGGPARADRRRAPDGRAAQPGPPLRRRRRRARPCSASTPSATAHTCTNPLYGRGCSLAARAGAACSPTRSPPTPTTPSARAAAVRGGRAARGRAVVRRRRSQMDTPGADPAGSAPAATRRRRGQGRWPRVFVAAATDPVIGRA